MRKTFIQGPSTSPPNTKMSNPNSHHYDGITRLVNLYNTIPAGFRVSQQSLDLIELCMKEANLEQVPDNKFAGTVFDQPLTLTSAFCIYPQSPPPSENGDGNEGDDGHTATDLNIEDMATIADDEETATVADDQEKRPFDSAFIRATHEVFHTEVFYTFKNKNGLLSVVVMTPMDLHNQIDMRGDLYNCVPGETAVEFVARVKRIAREKEESDRRLEKFGISRRFSCGSTAFQVDESEKREDNDETAEASIADEQASHAGLIYARGIMEQAGDVADKQQQFGASSTDMHPVLGFQAGVGDCIMSRKRKRALFESESDE